MPDPNNSLETALRKINNIITAVGGDPDLEDLAAVRRELLAFRNASVIEAVDTLARRDHGEQ